MQKVIAISLTGHTRQFRVTEDAYASIDRYLTQARTRLGRDADPEEVIGDLERSIGERLDALAPGDRVLDATQVRGVLDEIGSVDGDGGSPRVAAPRTPPRRKLYRIRKGQSIAGVCNGLAAYSDIGVDWVRFTFLVLLVFTAGLFLFVYVVMMFLLPVVDDREAWIQAMAEADQARGA
jgi:phage shock protein PspC (stress-responsive transcriptional regulator)